MGRLRIRTNPVQLGSAKAGTELYIGNVFVTRVLNPFIHETECLQGNKYSIMVFARNIAMGFVIGKINK